MKPLGEAIQKPGGDEPDETEDPSDFCDFGYNVVSNAHSQSDGHSDRDEAVREVFSTATGG